jgi:hypothetical protein
MMAMTRVVRRYATQDRVQNRALRALQLGLGRFDQSIAAAPLGDPSAVIVAQAWVACGPVHAARIHQPFELLVHFEEPRELGFACEPREFEAREPWKRRRHRRRGDEPTLDAKVRGGNDGAAQGPVARDEQRECVLATERGRRVHTQDMPHQAAQKGRGHRSRLDGAMVERAQLPGAREQRKREPTRNHTITRHDLSRIESVCRRGST